MAESKIKNLKNQTDLILDDDYLILDRESVPLRISGENYKAFCSSVMNSSVRYYKSEDVPCSTRGDVYDLGLSILNANGSSSGLPVRTVIGEVPSENGWMYAGGSPNRIIIAFSDSYEEYEEGDSTALSDDLLLETFCGLFIGTSGLAYKVSDVEE